MIEGMKLTVLFLNLDYMEYDQQIADKLCNKGYKVFFENYCPKPSLFHRIWRLLSGIKAATIATNCRQNQIVSKYKRKKIDVVFMTAGQKMRVDTLKKLRKDHSDAVFVWYSWDYEKIVDEFAEKIKVFDYVANFEKGLSQKYDIAYRPLFYCKKSDTPYEDRKNDISFVGTYHSNRQKYICKILESYPELKSRIHILKHDERNSLRKILDYLCRNSLKLEKYCYSKGLPYQEVIDITEHSKCLLDFPFSEQVGLTIRTFEALGAGCKLITSNKSIKNYDFYNPNNIYVVDLDSMELPERDFFVRKYEQPPNEIVDKYSLDSWIDWLVNIFNKKYERGS